jgi:hypothetical protein
MTQIKIIDRAGGGSFHTPALLLSAVLAAALSAGPVAAHGQKKGCSRSASFAVLACRHETMDDYFRSVAVCEHLPDTAERRECKLDARRARGEDLAACAEQRKARFDLCALTGENRYAPDFDPANFVDPNEIGDSVEPNPFFPLVVGNEWVYDDGEETTRVVVTDKIKRIEGVPCRVVNDVVSIDGVPVEDTNDWVAQDLEGNVWYCGEEVKDYETFEDDDPVELELVSIDGSFKAGRDGALPGIWVLAAPQVGDAYRQEADIGNAEDAVEVLSITGDETVPGASCAGNCLVTREFTPLEPGFDARNFYAPGIGAILEIGHDGTRNELIEFTPAE